VPSFAPDGCWRGGWALQGWCGAIYVSKIALFPVWETITVLCRHLPYKIAASGAAWNMFAVSFRDGTSQIKKKKAAAAVVFRFLVE
jgi:hypothetical protein